jgi:hypothetical protein
MVYQQQLVLKNNYVFEILVFPETGNTSDHGYFFLSEMKIPDLR